jgi:hypothetical protein
MTTETELSENPARAWQPEKFAKLRTFPEKWEFSAFSSPAASQSSDRQPAAPSSDSGSPHLSEEEPFGRDMGEGDPDDWNPDPFPEPRTFPSKWDLSSLT